VHLVDVAPDQQADGPSGDASSREPWSAAPPAPAPAVERRTRPSDALFVDFLLHELDDAHARIAELEALLLRGSWRRVS
jgi:hypothetical protein